MSYFPRILNREAIYRHDGRPLWDYHLSEREFQLLIQELKTATRHSLDPRDCALYYSEWWKRKYNGGIPSKEGIFNSINNGTLYSRVNAEEFYRLARKGGDRLKFNWISSTNTLYFRTLLLNGGLPLEHIRNNRTNYETFLSETLEIQPNSIQDVFEATHTHRLLPLSSQNEYIFSSCYDVVAALLSGSKKYDNVFKGDDVLYEILSKLKVVAQRVESRKNLIRTKQNWLISLLEDEATLSFQLLLNSRYSESDLIELFDVESLTSTHYYLMVDDHLAYKLSKSQEGSFICTTTKSTFKVTDTEDLPLISITGGEESKSLSHLLTNPPTLDVPTLWIEQESGIYRYSKTPFTPSKKATVLKPTFETDASIRLLGATFQTFNLEGEKKLEYQDKSYLFCCGVDTFEWSINSTLPKHVQSFSERTIANDLTIQLFEANGNKIPKSDFTVHIKSTRSAEWSELDVTRGPLPLGLIDLRITYRGIHARDQVFNIGALEIENTQNAAGETSFNLKGLGPFSLEGVSDEFTMAQVSGTTCTFKNTDPSKYNFSGIIKIKLGNQRHLKIKLSIPFHSIEFLSANKTIVQEPSRFCFNRLHGYRLIANPKSHISVTLYNNLRKAIRIKRASSHLFALIGLQEDIKVLYELGDPMNKSNFVVAEFKSDGILEKKIYLRPTTGLVELNADENYQTNTTIEDFRIMAIPAQVFDGVVDDFEVSISDLKVDSTELTSTYGELVLCVESDNPDIKLSPKRIRDESLDTSNDEFEAFQNNLFVGELDNNSWKVLMSYFQYCIDYDIPFSTFRQIRVLRQAPQAAIILLLRTLFNQEKPDLFIESHLDRFESDLGINLYTINRETWGLAVGKISGLLHHLYGNMFINEISELVGMYFDHHELQPLKQYIINGSIPTMIDGSISNADLNMIRGQLGTRVLKEIPIDRFECKSNYGIPIQEHRNISTLVHAGIAVAEEISGKHLDLFGNTAVKEEKRRNIQYCKRIDPKLFLRVIIQTLNRI